MKKNTKNSFALAFKILGGIALTAMLFLNVMVVTQNDGKGGHLSVGALKSYAQTSGSDGSSSGSSSSGGSSSGSGGGTDTTKTPPSTPILYHEGKMKSSRIICKTEPLNLSISGFNKTGTTYTAATLSLNFGSGVNYAYNCEAGGNLVVCQVINCYGQTILTVVEKS